MALRRNACRKFAVRDFLCVSVHRESHTETVDDVLVAEHCAGPALFRLRHHSLSPDGCGHHLQARIGAHGGDRCCSGSLLCAGGLKRRCVSHQYRRPLRGGARDHDRFISLSAHPRGGTRPSGSFLLSCPPVQNALQQLDLTYYVPCRIREHCVAVLGLGKTVDGDFLSSDDVELVETIAGYVAVALDNAQLYNSLEQKALEIVRLKDFSENIVESLNVGVLAVDLSGLVESWNTRMEQLFGVTRQEAVGAQLNALLPQELATEIASRGDGEQITGISKQSLH